VGTFVFMGGDHPEATVEAAIVVPVDPAPAVPYSMSARVFVGALVEHGGADALGLVEAVDCLHKRVVTGVADRADRWGDTFEFEVLGEPQRGVLRPGIAGRESTRHGQMATSCSTCRTGVIRVGTSLEPSLNCGTCSFGRTFDGNRRG
jgi:hypothetical protein